jgi:hypothetical protein
MISTNHQLFSADPPVSFFKNLKVRALEPEEYQRAGELLDREHYLGDVPQGRQLLQAVEYAGQWVALLDWGPATWKLADREEWIGWTPQQKAQRLGLVVLNRRFLVLGKTRMPNLASRSLALAIKALPEHWQQAHGYKPLLAETFSDIEQYHGTCYKVSNWIACGQTKGFARHRIDFYRKHDCPKNDISTTRQRTRTRIHRRSDNSRNMVFPTRNSCGTPPWLSTPTPERRAATAPGNNGAKRRSPWRDATLCSRYLAIFASSDSG